jgi:hypothetical protein
MGIRRSRRHHATRARHGRQRQVEVTFWVGTTLIVLSFGIYSVYPLLPFLPISLWQKGGAGIGLAAVSWGMFFWGSALVGRRGVAYLKRRRAGPAPAARRLSPPR